MKKFLLSLLLLPAFFGTAFASTLTVYPDAGSGGTTVDGKVARNLGAGSSETLTQVISGAGNDTNKTDVDASIQISRASNGSYAAIVFRYIDTYSTSALTSSATISSAIKSVYAITYGAGLGQMDFVTVASTPNSNNNLIDSDYGQLGSTNLGTKAYADWTNSQYNDITLNASGISNISKTGISRFGSRISGDINNSAGGTAYQLSYFTFSTADETGTTKDPKIVITYTIPVADDGGIIGQTPQNKLMYSLNMIYTRSKHMIAQLFTTAYAHE